MMVVSTLVLLSMLSIVVADHHDIEEIKVPKIDWQNVQQVMALKDAQLLKAIQQNPGLLENSQVLASLDVRIAKGNIALVNNNPKILGAWGNYLGIEFSVGAGIQSYDGTTMVTRGPDSSTFNPQDHPEIAVLEDGSLQFIDLRYVIGELKKTEQGLVIKGSTVDSLGNWVINNDNYFLLTDEDVVTSGTTIVKTNRGTFTISGRTRDYAVKFSGDGEFTVEAYEEHTKDPIEIRTPDPKDSFFIIQGSANVYWKGKMLFSPAQRQDGTNIPSSFGYYGEKGKHQKTTFTVTKKTRFCFDECNKEDLFEYSLSAVEVLRNRDKGINLNRFGGKDILKITAIEDNQIEANLQNQNYASIFADAGFENEITLTQTGKDEKQEPYYIHVTVTEGTYDVRGNGKDKIDGDVLYVPDNHAFFDKNNVLIQGMVKMYVPKDGQGPAYIPFGGNTFNLEAYQQGFEVNQGAVQLAVSIQRKESPEEAMPLGKFLETKFGKMGIDDTWKRHIGIHKDDLLKMPVVQIKRLLDHNVKYDQDHAHIKWTSDQLKALSEHEDWDPDDSEEYYKKLFERIVELEKQGEYKDVSRNSILWGEVEDIAKKGGMEDHHLVAGPLEERKKEAKRKRISRTPFQYQADERARIEIEEGNIGEAMRILEQGIRGDMERGYNTHGLDVVRRAPFNDLWKQQQTEIICIYLRQSGKFDSINDPPKYGTDLMLKDIKETECQGY